MPNERVATACRLFFNFAPTVRRYRKRSSSAISRFRSPGSAEDPLRQTEYDETYGAPFAFDRSVANILGEVVTCGQTTADRRDGEVSARHLLLMQEARHHSRRRPQDHSITEGRHLRFETRNERPEVTETVLARMNYDLIILNFANLTW
jgi:hypothetical protein